MRGYPKHVNTRRDLEIAFELDPVRARGWVEAIIDTATGWHTTGHLADQSDGVTDDTHRVVDYGDAERGSDWYQEELGVIPGNALERIGVAIEEAEAMLS